MARAPRDPKANPLLNPYAMGFRSTRYDTLDEPGGSLDAHSTRWFITALHRHPDDRETPLGWARLRILRICEIGWDKTDLCVVADEEGGDLLDLFERDWMDRLPSVDDLEPFHLLVLEKVFVEKEFRGNGLGPLIGGMAINGVLSSDVTHAVCFPAPFEEYPGRTKRQATASLRRTWRKLGFSHLNQGVFGLDLTTTAFGDAFEAVKADIIARLPDVWEDEEDEEDEPDG